MFDEVAGVLEDIDAILAAVDVHTMVADEPTRALEVVGHHERAVAGLRTRLTARAESLQRHAPGAPDSPHGHGFMAATKSTSAG